MPPFKHHVLVCTQDKQDGVPSCSASGGKALLETFRTRLQVAGLAEHVLLTGCGCLGVCERGPNVVIHPQGRWHTAVQPEEVDRIIREDLLDGPALEPRGEPDDETLRREALAHRTKVRGMMQARANAGAIPDELMNLVRGFQPARAILTAVELDLFSAVGQGASAAQVAAKLSTDARATAMLLNVAASFGLLVRSADGYCTTELSSKFLCADSPHDSRAALMHSAHLWTTWSTLTECVRKGGTLSSGPGARGDQKWTEAFIAAMHKNATLRAPVVVAGIGLGSDSRVLDLGGGSGAYSIAMARAKADVHCTLFDLPEVLPLARKYVTEAGVVDRVEFAAGNLHTDRYGEGFDLVLISAICHMMGPQENLAMLRKAASALRPGGRVAIQDYVLADDGTGLASATLFSLNMLVGTQTGSAYRGKDYLEWLVDAGFTGGKVVKLPGPTGLVIGTRS